MGPQGEVEQLQHPLLHVAVEVDEQVAADDEVEAGEGGVAQDVVRREEHQVAHLLPHAVVAAVLHEEAVQALGRHVGGDGLVVLAFAGRADGLLVDVAREDLQPRGVGEGLGVLAQQDGERVRLLPRRAAAAPHPHAVGGALAGEEPGDDLVLEHGEGLLVAEEVGHRDEQVAQQRLHLLGPLAQQLEVGAQAVELVHLHPPAHPAQQRRALVAVEVVAGAHPEQREDVPQGPPGGPGRRLGLGGLGPGLGEAQAAGGLHDGQQLLRQLGRRQHDVDHPGADGAARHPVVLGVLGALGHDDAVALLDPLDPQRAVGAGPREDQRDGPAAVGLGQAAEEEVDGHAPPPDELGLLEADVAVFDRQVLGGRDDVDVLGLDGDRPGDLGDRHRRADLEDLGEVALVPLREVQHDHEGHAVGRGHGREELLQRVDPPGRGADADDDEAVVLGRG
ncbi:hypothetical protein Mterra_03670 [Calidithermus terrae]|uniref:Uncharacterized protein n=1 Tax=Calidithermus terrae TaxID=1408545 RepID=A0A399E1P4_9DEIN|nr:hypothetical protein Mterra_03670 [Calidithermus terrae]